MKKNTALLLGFGGTTIVVAIVAAIAAGTLHTSPPGASKTPSVGRPQTSTSASPSPADAKVRPDVDGQKPGGCVAGELPGVDAILDLQDEKKFTPNGAVEFLGAYQQFLLVSPFRPTSDYEAVLSEAATPDVAERFLNGLDRSSTPPPAAHASLSSGFYYVDSVSEASVTVSTIVGMVPAGSSVATMAMSGTYTLTATPEGWVVSAESGGRPAESTRAAGSRFQGGC